MSMTRCCNIGVPGSDAQQQCITVKRKTKTVSFSVSRRVTVWWQTELIVADNFLLEFLQKADK